MSKKQKEIIVCMDSFKGSLTSKDACQAVYEGLIDGRVACPIRQVPVSDGGEGFIDAFLALSRGTRINVEVVGPYSERQTTEYAILEDGSTAVIEMAAASGLYLSDKRNPLMATSYGTGELISHALERGVSKIFLGLGGSATNDGGIGALSALGVKFYKRNGQSKKNNQAKNKKQAEKDYSPKKSIKEKNSQGLFIESFHPIKMSIKKELSKDIFVKNSFPKQTPIKEEPSQIILIENPLPKDMLDLLSIDSTHINPRFINCEIIACCDVRNTLLGPEGASFIYGPQKGASLEDIDYLDKSLTHYKNLLLEHTGKDISTFAGSGAAGGLAAGLYAFNNLLIRPGIQVILELADFENLVSNTSLFFVGEGRIDGQSSEGKAPVGVARAVRASEVRASRVGDKRFSKKDDEEGSRVEANDLRVDEMEASRIIDERASSMEETRIEKERLEERGKSIDGWVSKGQIPIIALVGQKGPGYEKVYESGVTAVFASLNKPGNFDEIKKDAYENLRDLARNIGKILADY